LFIKYADNSRYNTISNTEDDIRDVASRLKVMNKAMEVKREALYAKFTAMETALAKMNSQSSALLAQLGVSQQQ
jgi:flagellar hook-associated protein 2